jgi:ribosomal protein S18 acetylase RimI-like enzyme
MNQSVLPEFIRVSDAAQIGQIAMLAQQIWHEHYTPIIGVDQVRYMLERFQSGKAIATQISHQGYDYYLIRAGEEGCGYLAVRPEERALFLSKIYLTTQVRGRGWGRAALGFVEGLARDRGLDRISLTVNKNNNGSIAFYRASGFSVTGSVVQDIGAGYVMDDYCLERLVR